MPGFFYAKNSAFTHRKKNCSDTVKFYYYFALCSHNKTGYITQVGTGSYNEKTNAMYTDLGFMTTDHAIGEDTAAFFRNMLVNKLAEASRAGVKGQLIMEKPGLLQRLSPKTLRVG